MCIFNFKIPRPQCRTLEDILGGAAGHKHTQCCDGPTKRRLACFSCQFQFFGQFVCGSTTELGIRCSSKESHDQSLWETQPGSESWNGIEKRHQNSQCCSGGSDFSGHVGRCAGKSTLKEKEKKRSSSSKEQEGTKHQRDGACNNTPNGYRG